MCISSFIGNDYTKNHPYKWPSDNSTFPVPTDPFKYWPPKGLKPDPNEAEIERLKKELEDLKILLKKANEFDAAHNEPHCEVEEKIETIKNHGDHFGIDFSEVFDETLPTEPETPYEPFKVMSVSKGFVAKFSTRQLAEKFVDYLVGYTGEDKSDFEIHEVERIDTTTLSYGVFSDLKLVAAFTTLDDAVHYLNDLISRVWTETPFPAIVVKVI